MGGTNTAEVTAIDQPDSDSVPGNNNANEDDQASTTFTTQVADLSLNKTVDNAMPNQSQSVNFALTLSNAGPDNATDVAIRDLLPAGLRFVSSSPSIGQYDATTGRWTLATLPAGASATLGIEAAVTSATPATNVAEVVAVRQFDPDSQPDNGVTTEDDYSQQAVMPQVVDISVSSSVDNPEPLEGDTIRIVFTALNSGPAGATGVQLNTLLPLGLTLITSQPQVGSYNSVTGLWDVGNLASGATAQLVLNARVDTRGVKTVSIEVTATDQFDVDSTPNNNVPAEDDQSEVVIRRTKAVEQADVHVTITWVTFPVAEVGRLPEAETIQHAIGRRRHRRSLMSGTLPGSATLTTFKPLRSSVRSIWDKSPHGLGVQFDVG